MANELDLILQKKCSSILQCKMSMEKGQGENEEGRNLWVLVNTSLDTHMGMSVSPTTTAGQLKRELGKEHPICFPSIGGIKINGIMVKRRSCYYHLPDSVVLKVLFQGWNRTCSLHVDLIPSDSSLHVDAIPLDSSGEPYQAECTATKELKVCDDADSREPEEHITCKFKVNTQAGAREGGAGEDLRSNRIIEKNQTHERIKRNKKWNKEMRSREKVVASNEEVHGVVPSISLEEEGSLHCDISKGMNQGGQWSRPAIEAPSLSVSEVASVTGLITRYFPEFDKSPKYPSHCSTSSETGSCASYHGPMKKQPKRKSSAELDSFPSSAEHISRASRGRSERPEVGRRLLAAAANCASKKKSATAICQNQRGKLLSSVDEALVFEISDSV